LQADKLDEGVNGRFFINPPPGSPEAGNKNIVYEVLRPLYGIPSSPRALHKTIDAYFKSEGFDTIGLEESVWVRPAGGKYSEDIYVSAHVDDCLLSCKSLTVMAEFKTHMLDRFIGTDEGEVTEYLGCELVRDRKARTGQLIQAGYAERVLRVFNMWECNPVATPSDPNVRLSKLDCPEVVDPLVHRKYRSIAGHLMVLNGGPVSWKASRQGGVTLSSSEAEFVAASLEMKYFTFLRSLKDLPTCSMVLQRSGKIPRLASS
jgi:hypothetical protein